MKLRKITFALLLLVAMPLWLIAQNENIDLSMVYKIRQEGNQNSKIEELIFGLTDLTGPRLTGSTGGAKGNEWAKKAMEEMGFQNVRIEEARDFTRGGWDNLKTYAAMTEPYYTNFSCTPVAWTGSTKGLVSSEVVLLDVNTIADLDKYKGKLSGKIVLVPGQTQYDLSFDPLASRLTDKQLSDLAMAPALSQSRRPTTDAAASAAQNELRGKLQQLILSENIAVVINNSGIFNVPRSTGYSYTAGSPEPVAMLNLPIEAAGRMERLLRKNVPVKMEIEIQNRFFPSNKVYNVYGEIPGTDKVLKNEYVLLGAHIDSWQAGTGAADNAAGCVVMMEALRILKEINANPKRTIRVALWGGEEQGLNGSRGYVEKYLFDATKKEKKPEWDKFAGYFNMDNGSGKYRGIYLQQNDILRPVFEEWLKPFADMGCSTITIRNTSGTDHLSFDAAGLPGFQFIQDGLEYSRGYHTNMDTYERLVIPDLKHNAIITAAMAYFAANRPVKLQGKPPVK